ncbi:hypothetical protein GSI_12257 [Ganoderma sinense ZZ0214-1]|uniref:BTB domain-containing protein n=1 Tax=Ganoderma sinense ZZ0214-1 TaxID=1077348 RepID=A0A2G8RYA1_9APHY|nr:hypothetical protein GSI_12257 [Ganoderma sinense ZZ0214-1]
MSDLDARPWKRTRLSTADFADPQSGPSASSSTSSSNLRRHPEIWYDDGNLVLVAGQFAFRIYRGLIAGQSTVFSDLFASSTSSLDETFEECPVIHLFDSPQDLVHLLRILLPQSRIHYHTPIESPTRTFDELFAVIRLAHKYNIPQVLEQALASLRESGFTTSFAAYSRLPSNPESALDPRCDPGQHNIGVVNVARLIDAPSLLPVALYHCTYLGSELFDGWTRDDGTIEHLSDADLRLCVDARAVLVHAHTVLLFSVFDGTVSAGCAKRTRCAAGLRDAQRVFVHAEALAQGYQPLRYSWAEAVLMLEERKKVCGSCAREMLERAKNGQKEIFDKLPKIFGITVEGWGADETEVAMVAGEEPE